MFVSQGNPKKAADKAKVKDTEHWIKRKFILTDETLRYFRPSDDTEIQRRDRAVAGEKHTKHISQPISVICDVSL